jgi:DNA-binding LytR/AlgR family response regulator
LKSEGNYVAVNFSTENTNKRELCRITLKEFKILLNPYPQFAQSKKSFIVNMDKVVSCKGNTEGMKLKLENCLDIVEVSRGFVAVIKKIMKGY